MGQPHHGLSNFQQSIPGFALHVSFDIRSFNGLGLVHRTHPLLCVHCRQSSSQKIHAKFLPSLLFTHLLEFLWARLEYPFPSDEASSCLNPSRSVELISLFWLEALIGECVSDKIENLVNVGLQEFGIKPITLASDVGNMQYMVSEAARTRSRES